MKNWLDRCECVCCPDTDLLSADKVKIRNELQIVQVHFSIFLICLSVCRNFAIHFNFELFDCI